MKLLHLTDFHANRRWYNWTLDHAEAYDLIAYTGDFVDAYGFEPLESQVRWIAAWAKLLPRPFIWTTGNHDLQTMIAPTACGEWLRRLPGAKAFGNHGHHDCLGHTFTRVKWRGVVPSLSDGDIVLSHAGPSGLATATTESGADGGSMDLSDALWAAPAPPWLMLSGHVPDPVRWIDRSAGAISINPGVNAGATAPNHVTIDTMTEKARLFRNGELADEADLSPLVARGL